MKITTDTKKIEEVLTRGVELILPSLKSLKERMLKGERLRLYCGYDPSSPHLHIGHITTLKKLAQFQKLGHEAIMLIGDFTGTIGDPTDKTAARKKLSKEEALENSKNYKKMAGKILDFEGLNPVKMLYNSEWLGKISFTDLIELASFFTVQQMIVRDMFQERLKTKKPIFLHEFLYPLAQAYDSIAMDVDLEVGGKDQLFNMLCGRDLMKNLKNKEKFVLGLKLLVGSEGKKMGKTEGNTVNIDDNPEEMYGKIMSWQDELINSSFELLTDIPLEELKDIEKGLKLGKINPRDAKARLAREIVSLCHSRKDAETAEDNFEKVFKKKETPLKIPTISLEEKRMNILDLLVKTKLAVSRAEAKRLVVQKGVRVNEIVKNDWKEEINIKKGTLIQVGKRRFVKVV